MKTSRKFPFLSAGKTHPGLVRMKNQDAFIALPEKGIWVVADGVGGHSHGETASQMIVDAVRKITPIIDLHQRVSELEKRIKEVNRHLIDLAKQVGGGEVIASTVAALVASREQCVCLWAGDSRIYGYREGVLTRLTRDHSLVEELKDAGVLSPEQAKDHPEANVIYRAVGKDTNLELDVVMYDIMAEDRFLLCTDGLTKEVMDNEISGQLSMGDSATVCESLLQMAIQRGCRDNITVIVVDVLPPFTKAIIGDSQISTAIQARTIFMKV